MVRTFGTVIGISVGIVGLVFLTVVALLYRSGDSTLPEPALKPLAVQDSSRTDLETLNMATLPAKTQSGSAAASGNTPSKGSATILSSHTVVKQQSRAATTTPRSTGAARQIEPRSVKGEMSTNEYVERETYYLNKIDQSSDQVLQRSAEINQQLADLKAQLEALQGSN